MMGLRETALAAAAEQRQQTEDAARERRERAEKEIADRGATAIRVALKLEEVGKPISVELDGSSAFGATGHADWIIDGLRLRWSRRAHGYGSYGTYDELGLVRECPKCGGEDVAGRISFLYHLGMELEREPHSNGCPKPESPWVGDGPLAPVTPPEKGTGEQLVDLIRSVAFDAIAAREEEVAT